MNYRVKLYVLLHINLVVKNYNDKFEYTPYIDERKNRETYDYLTKIYSHSKAPRTTLADIPK